MFDLNEELKRLPDLPGVYIMKDKSGDTIYVGKAISLKNRVRQYFNSLSGQSNKVSVMVSKIAEFEYIVTHSELEALILECNLIKKIRPKFNILLKDDKHYPYIKVTMNEQFPRVLMTRKIEKDGAKYFGPYSDAFAVKSLLGLIKKIFPQKSCKRILPRDIGRGRPCLNFHISRCPGPCMGNIKSGEYRELMKDICGFISGKHDKTIKRLERQMKLCSKNLEFEKAAALRDKIIGLKHTAEEQKMFSTDLKDRDAISFAKNDTRALVQVFSLREGRLIGREHFFIEITAESSDKEIITSFVKQFYAVSAFMPGEIMTSVEIEDKEVIKEWLSRKRGGKVWITAPKKGEKLHLIEMGTQNADMLLKRFESTDVKQKEQRKSVLRDIAEIIDFEGIPERLEAYDISNTGTSQKVGSMVVFEGGMPKKSQYRRFKIKTVSGQDDYAAMQEVLDRRLARASKDSLDSETKISADGFEKPPDIILVDGGIGHMNAVNEVLSKRGFQIPVLGMVKGSGHITRGLIWQRDEVDLSTRLSLLRFIAEIQNEAHRFALEYNKKLREKRDSLSALDEIKGIGKVRKTILLKHFKSISAIKKAGIDDLESIEGIDRATAKSVFKYFNKE